ncbi:Lipocalin, partial [Struthio camelus australis]
MQATLLSILGLALLGALHAQESIPVQADFQQDQFTGKWYSIGLASNSNWFKEKKHLMKMCTTVVSATEEGNLEVTSTYPKSDECKKLELFFQQSGQAGHYIDTEEKRDLRVMETDYDHYAIVYTVKESDREPSTTLQLYTRGQDVDPQLLKKFKELYPTMGLTDDMLVVMPKSGECQQG